MSLLLQGILNKKHILLLGIPRTGSTWLGKILSVSANYTYIHEPDNERHTFYGYYGKQDLPRFPILISDDNHKRYYEVFETAFHQPFIGYDSFSNQILKKWVGLTPERVEADLQKLGKNPERDLKVAYIFGHMLPKQIGNRNSRVVKSVHAILAADFILSNFTDVYPVFVIRHPAAVIASMMRMKNEDIDRKLYQQPQIIEKFPQLKQIDLSQKPIEYLAGMQIAIFYDEIARLISKYNTPLIQFEQLAEDPFLTSYRLFEDLDLKWNDNVEMFIANSNQKGTGYETRRETEKQAFKWKDELAAEQIRWIAQGYNALGVNEFYDEFY